MSCALAQAELDAANATWSFTDYSHTTHAFTLPSNPLWTSGPARSLSLETNVNNIEQCGAVLPSACTAQQEPALCIHVAHALHTMLSPEA